MDQTTLLPHGLKKKYPPPIPIPLRYKKIRDINHALVEKKNVFYYQTFRKLNGNRRKICCTLSDLFNPQ